MNKTKTPTTNDRMQDATHQMTISEEMDALVNSKAPFLEGFASLFPLGERGEKTEYKGQKQLVGTTKKFKKPGSAETRLIDIFVDFKTHYTAGEYNEARRLFIVLKSQIGF